ncbi:Ig-like domain repeat protein [Pantoea sp. S18]|uniref:Ig-like domain repeat protein n=1 Tax=Pantoea sp. S18 TaxID=3019892 RepID=UPI002B208B26|nr:Ig-like domain repeat protein [Pantoea sp. S18]MEA5102493.1 hypothetical protein [Pantoea sp. S18]
MDFKKNRYNPYGTEQDELPVAQTSVATAVMAAAPAAVPEERFDAERSQKISSGSLLETQAGLIIQNHNSRLEIAEFNWFGYNSKTLQVGEKSTINFTLGAQGMSEFSFDYFALHNHTTVMNFYDVNGTLIGSEKLLYTGSVTAKQFVIKTLSFTAPSGTQIARAELVTGDEPAVGDYGFHVDNVRWAAAGPLPVNFTFDRMQKDTGTSATDFITKDGSAGRQVEGTLSRALSANETLEFWDGSRWVAASVNGMRWQAQDGTAHAADWEYRLRVVDAAGNATPEQSHQVVLDVTPPPVQVIFERMSKDDGVADDWRTADGSAGRLVSGSLDRTPDAGDVAEYSYDGGKTWHTLTLNGLDWSFTDPDSHNADWQYLIRFTDIAGNVAAPAVQDVVLLPGDITFTFDLMEKDTGSSDTDFITKDGSAGRQVEGTMSRTLAASETLQFWDGSKWVNAIVSGLSWQAPDNTAHAADWEYKLRVVDAAGNTTPEQSQQVVLDVMPSDVQIIFERMSKDDGIADDWQTTDGSSGRLVSGKLDRALTPGDLIEYSLDGGTTWHKLTLNGLNWSFTDGGAHAVDWQYQVRITDIAGNVAAPVTQDVLLLPGAISLTFTRMEKDTGTSDNDFITRDGSAGRQVEGTLSRLLNPGEKLEFWDGTQWVVATVNGLTWQAQDNIEHHSRWDYWVRVVDAAGTTVHDQLQNVLLDTTSSDVQIHFERMEKDDGIANDWRTSDGSAGRTVYGTLSKALSAGDLIEYSLDGGMTWKTLTVNGVNWSFVDDIEHSADWEYQVRITDVAGNISSPHKQQATLESVLAEVTIDAVSKDSGFAARDADFLTRDGAAGRLVHGSISEALKPGEKVQVSFDDGVTWHDAQHDGKKWFVVDNGIHNADWVIKARVANANSFGKEQQQTLHYHRVNVDAPEITWDGKQLAATLPATAVTGETLQFMIDGKSVVVNLSAADIASGKAIVALDSSQVGNPKDIRASYIDMVGNNSNWRVLKPELKSEYLESFNKKSATAIKTGDEFIFDAFTLKALSVSNGEFKNRFGNTNQGGIGKPPTSMALEIANGGGDTSYKIDLKNNKPANRISFLVGDLNLHETITATFYDAAGKVVRTLTQAGTQSADITTIAFELPYGEVFSSLKFTLNYSQWSYVWLDDVKLSYVDYIPQSYTEAPLHLQIINQNTLYMGSDSDDVFQLSDASYLNSNDFFLRGQGGIDTLQLTGKNINLDLTALAGKIQSTEIINLTGTGNNTLSLSLGDVLQQGGKDLFNMSGNVQMVVKGNAGDKVNLSDLLPDNGDVGDWSSSGNVTVGGVVYAVWQHSAIDAELLVQSGVTTTLINH